MELPLPTKEAEENRPGGGKKSLDNPGRPCYSTHIKTVEKV